MSPRYPGGASPRDRFPRVSGDEPVVADILGDN